MTYEQEFGLAINTAFVNAGFKSECLGGNLYGWSKTLPNGVKCQIVAYEGQLYAEPNEPVWSAFWFDAEGEELGGGIDDTMQDCIDGHTAVPGMK